MTQYGNAYDSRYSSDSDVIDEMRTVAGELDAFAEDKLLWVVFVKRGDIKEASRYFIGLANEVSANPNWQSIDELQDKIEINLKLERTMQRAVAIRNSCYDA